MGVKPLLMFSLLLIAFGARAQHAANDTTLKGSSIQIIQSYKPQVKQAPKPGWIPRLPPADTSRPVFTYDVPPQSLYYGYSSLPLRPLSLTGDTVAMPYRDYVKAGAGNLSTLYLDAGIGSLCGDDYETAIHVHHISQLGAILNEQTAQSGVEADGTLHEEKNDWHASVAGERNQYDYYGYNHEVYHYHGDSLEQIYTTARVNVDMQNKVDSNTTFSYHPAITGSVYDGRFSTSESNFGISVPMSFRLDTNLSLPVAASGIFTGYKSGGYSASNNIAALSAGLDIHGLPGVNGHAILAAAAGKSGLYVLPDLLAVYALPGNKYTFSAGWQATLRQNTYEQLTMENPFINPLYAPEQTRKDEVFGNALISVGNHITVSARVSWWNFNDLPTFLNNVGDEKQFYVGYINANALSFSAAFRYKIAEIWSLGATGDFYNYYGSSSAKVYVWGEPNTKIKGDLMYSPIPKLTITAYLALMSGIWQKNALNESVKLKMITDLGGNVEYQLIKRLSVFVQVNNLLNQEYQRWLGYQSYGINVYGGLRLKF